MTPEEKFIFDLEGYIVIKNVLSDAELVRMNAEADVAFPDEGEETAIRRASQISQWGPSFQDLWITPRSYRIC